MSVIFKALSTIEEGEGVQYPDPLLMDPHGSDSVKRRVGSVMRLATPILVVLVVTGALVVELGSRLPRLDPFQDQGSSKGQASPGPPRAGHPVTAEGEAAAEPAVGESPETLSGNATAGVKTGAAPRPLAEATVSGSSDEAGAAPPAGTDVEQHASAGAGSGPQGASAGDGESEAVSGLIFEPAFAGPPDVSSPKTPEGVSGYQSVAANDATPGGGEQGFGYMEDNQSLGYEQDQSIDYMEDQPPDDPDARYFGQMQQARTSYSETTAIDDARTEQVRILNSQLNRAIRKRDLDQIDQALDDIAILAGHGTPYMLKLRAFTELSIGGDSEYAMKLLDKVLASNPEDREAEINMAVAEINLGEIAEARQRLETLSLAHPRDARIEKLLRSIQ